MSDFKTQAEEFYLRLKGRKQRTGSIGFLVYAKRGQLDYSGGGTAKSRVAEENKRCIIAGLYRFDLDGFDLSSFIDDCVMVLEESISLRGGKSDRV